MKKNILDATEPLRVFLKRKGIHDFDLQRQGQENKVGVKTTIIIVNDEIETQVSLYRPNTKKGDPRFWIKKLNKYVDANDKIAIFAEGGELYIINITKNDLEFLYSNNLSDIIQRNIEHLSPENSDAFDKYKNELFQKLISIGSDWISVANTDTAIGRDIESRLGIEMNSRKKPDYKGIELKSYSGDGNKGNLTLFGQFPNWEELSAITSVEELIKEIGYAHTVFGKDYLTFNNPIKYQRPTKGKTKGLSLNILRQEELFDLLELEKGEIRKYSSGREKYHTIKKYVGWDLETIHKELLNKHNRTMWIGVDKKIIDSKIHYKIRHIDYSKAPNIAQFDNLLQSRIIFLEISLNRWYQDKFGTMKTHGNNFNFRMQRSKRHLLFPKIDSRDL